MKPHRKNDSAPDRLKLVTGCSTDSPIRRCIVSLERLPKTEMVRFVADPVGNIVPDIAEKLPGRGVWVRSHRDSVEKACATNAFSRGLKTNIQKPDNLSNTVEGLLLNQCKGLLGFARKSGTIVTGFEQVQSKLRARCSGWIIEASDGANDGRQKLLRLVRAICKDIQIAGALRAQEIGDALGQQTVVHALLVQGTLSERWAIVYRKLVGFRDAPELIWTTQKESN